MRAHYFGNSQANADTIIDNLLHPRGNYIAVDTETVSLTDKTCIGIGIATSPTDSYYIPVFPQASEILYQVYDLLARRNIVKVYHNANFDLQVLRQFATENNLTPPDVWNVHDTNLMANVSANPPDLETLSYKLLHEGNPLSIDGILEEARQVAGKKNVTMLDADPAKVARKCAYDCEFTFRIFEPLLQQLTTRTAGCYEVDRRLSSWLRVIELRGLKLNEQRLIERYNALCMQLEGYEEHADELGFSISSPAQVGMWLANNRVVLPITKSGRQLDTSNEVLEQVKHPMAKEVLEYRGIRKTLSTYVEPWLDTGRAYTHFRLDLATGRLASYDRNLQNIPPDLRDCFTPDNSEFTWADMSQLEMRVFAYFTQDPVLKDAYATGKSIHEITFRSIYPNLEFRKDIHEYTQAKTANFAMIFDAADETIAAQCKITPQLAGQWKKAWFNTYQGAHEWMKQQQSTNSTYEETIFGRQMIIPKDRGWAHANKCRINYPIQGSGADLNKRALLYMLEHLKGEDIRIQVHDEVVNDGDIEFPLKDISEMYPGLEVPWEVFKDKVWL